MGLLSVRTLLNAVLKMYLMSKSHKQNLKKRCIESREDPTQIDRCLRCGIVQTFNDLRCIGCESSLPGDWPWMARLLYK